MVQVVLRLGTWKGTFQVRGSYLVQLSQFRELQCNLLIFVLLKKFGSPKYYENTVVLSCATPVNVGLISIRCVHFVWHCLVKIPMACGANSLAWSPLPPPLFSLSFTGLGCTTQSPLHYQSTGSSLGPFYPLQTYCLWFLEKENLHFGVHRYNSILLLCLLPHLILAPRTTTNRQMTPQNWGKRFQVLWYSIFSSSRRKK